MRLATALALSSLLFAGSAGAFDRPEPGQTLCYGRHYDEAHLRANPEQLVRTLVLELFQWKDYEGLNFSLRVELADDALHNWWTTGACVEEAGRTLCAIDCDGGAFHLADAKGGLMLLNDLQGFATQMACGEELPEEPGLAQLPADKANAAYRLVPLPDDFCPTYEAQ